ncbi:MAG: peptidase C45 [Telmatospirillum sp.]|nr:peptidase C45 [Telmatospirillum sp.]
MELSSMPSGTMSVPLVTEGGGDAVVVAAGVDCRMRLSGNRHEIGYRHGLARRAAIHRFLADGSARLEAITGRTGGELRRDVPRYGAVIGERVPAMAEEVAGLAMGAGISLTDAWLLQLRREIAGYQSVRCGGDCTTFVRSGPRGWSLCQTIDLNGHMADELCVLEIAPDDCGRRLWMVSFTGLLGYLGMNDRGLAIGINLVLAGDWEPGIPGYMTIRHLLEHADNIDDCLALLADLPLASSRTFTICEPERAVMVEHIRGEIALLADAPLCHANHFLHPGFLERDELNPFARTSSLRRLQACRDRLDRLTADATDEDLFEVLETPPILVPADGDVRRECTVASVVMHPRRPGAPGQGSGRLCVRRAPGAVVSQQSQIRA